MLRFWKVKVYEWIQNRSIYKLYPEFKQVDRELLSGPNPYSIKEAFPYGETPLTTLLTMAKRWGIGPKDHFVDLGCGRGRNVFFLAYAFGCTSHGIDKILSFIQQAQNQSRNNPKVSFSCGDIQDYDFKRATFVYLYGTGFTDDVVQGLTAALKSLPRNSKIVSVSYPLEGFSLQDQFEGSFPWGKGAIYLQINSKTL